MLQGKRIALLVEDLNALQDQPAAGHSIKASHGRRPTAQSARR